MIQQVINQCISKHRYIQGKRKNKDMKLVNYPLPLRHRAPPPPPRTRPLWFILSEPHMHEPSCPKYSTEHHMCVGREVKIVSKIHRGELIWETVENKTGVWPVFKKCIFIRNQWTWEDRDVRALKVLFGVFLWYLLTIKNHTITPAVIFNTLKVL